MSHPTGINLARACLQVVKPPLWVLSARDSVKHNPKLLHQCVGYSYALLWNVLPPNSGPHICGAFGSTSHLYAVRLLWCVVECWWWNAGVLLQLKQQCQIMVQLAHLLDVKLVGCRMCRNLVAY